MSEKVNEKIAEKAGQLQGCCTSIKGAAIRNQKLFKKLGIALVAIIILGGIGHAIFTVEGVVTGVSGDTITVTNFWGSSDVALTEPWKSSTSIEAGDHVRIVTNLQGVIIGVRDGSERGFGRDQHGDAMCGDKDDRMDRNSHDGDKGARFDEDKDSDRQGFEGRQPDKNVSNDVNKVDQTVAPTANNATGVNNAAPAPASPVANQ